MTTHTISVDARRPEATFALRIMGYSSALVEITIRDGALLSAPDDSEVLLWYGPQPEEGQAQTGHTVAATASEYGCALIHLTLADTSFDGRLNAQIVSRSTATGESCVLATGTIWMLANPARDTAPMAFDTPPWATPSDIVAAISGIVADIDDLPENASGSQANTLLRRLLAALKGVVPMLFLACAVQAEPVRHGDILEDSMVETNGVPASVVAQMIAEGGGEPLWIANSNVVTAGAAKGATAVQVEADTLATVTARGATTTNSVTIDPGDLYTNKLGGKLTILGQSVKSGSGTEAGNYSNAEGGGSFAFGMYSHAEGEQTRSSGQGSHSAGYKGVASHLYSWAWQGVFPAGYYTSHGDGTFNINPVGGLHGFWIGQSTLGGLLDAKPSLTAVTNTVQALTVAPLYSPVQEVAYSLTNTLAISAAKTVYQVAVTANTTIALNLAAVDFSKGVASWQTWLYMDSTNRLVTLPSTNLVQYLEAIEPWQPSNSVIQIAWQAWTSGAVTNVQANKYGSAKK